MSSIGNASFFQGLGRSGDPEYWEEGLLINLRPPRDYIAKVVIDQWPLDEVGRKAVLGAISRVVRKLKDDAPFQKCVLFLRIPLPYEDMSGSVGYLYAQNSIEEILGKVLRKRKNLYTKSHIIWYLLPLKTCFASFVIEKSQKK